MRGHDTRNAQMESSIMGIVVEELEGGISKKERIFVGGVGDHVERQ